MYIKLGNTWFKKNLGKHMSFKRFCGTYSGRFHGMSFEDAYKALGGKIPEKEDKEPDKGKKKP